ncbi:hypothetical protein FDH38_gp105 [Dinoroseobacter phage vB_DshS-R5C]|uniref:Uncharacterized protein n=1 Tax=Dinoroseobacter phage vB_DshS-R5C TaxID=1965368 RepID=A0A1V0DYD7_9CAUD|nr:hypothetical protein FDH38_gp105 [Dinoroseobacter phage vB_DshS-R5C]ARB06159.1 hypothetical protein vBDshSR5C_105 [Dinoroseobacter phage vB_DshS-R5C]
MPKPKTILTTYSQIGRDDDTTREWRWRFPHDTAIEYFNMIPELEYYVGFEPDQSGVLLLSHDFDALKGCIKVPLRNGVWTPALKLTRGATLEKDPNSNWRASYGFRKMEDFGFPHPDKWSGKCKVIYAGGGIVRLQMLEVEMPVKQRERVQAALRIGDD